MFVRMLKLPDEVRARYDVSSLQCVIHAAAPCPMPVKQQMIEWFGPIIHEYYAGTEGNGFVYCNSEHVAAPTRARSARRSAASSTSSTTTATSCPHGETGTVYFEGGATFEYHNDPEKTAALAASARLERRSATSATSTTTTSSTSPTARPT